MCFHFALSTQTCIECKLQALCLTPVFLFKTRTSSVYQEIRLSTDTVLSNLQSHAELTGCPRNALCKVEGWFPGQHHELYLAISVQFMIIRAYLDWSKVLFACAYLGKGHFLDLIHIQQQNIGCVLFFIFLRHSHLRHWQISC